MRAGLVDGSADGLELGGQQVLPTLRQPEPPYPEGRVLLGVLGCELQWLVRTRVQGADRDRTRPECFQHGRVAEDLFVQGRRRGPVQEHEFGAEQADALHIGGPGLLGVSDRPDVGVERNCGTVCEPTRAAAMG